MDVLALLRSKNKCLQRFLELSEEFVKLADAQDFSTLPRFESSRDAALKAIDLYDRKISEAVALLPSSSRNSSLAEAVEEQLKRKEALIHRILSLDLKILTSIENQRNQILKDMTEVQKSHQQLGKFKSAWLPEAGGELDEKA